MNAQSPSYRTLDPEALKAYLVSIPALRDRLGKDVDQWTIREVSDGNLNMVWLVHGSHGSLCAKQSLPHVRVDPSWKMPLDRTTFEAAWLRETETVTPEMVPTFLHFDPDLYLLATACLDNHVTLTEALAAGCAITPIVRQIGAFIARTTFHNSFRGTSFETMARLEQFFSGNITLARITIDLVLTDPYHAHPRNHFHPDLSSLVHKLHTDTTLHRTVSTMQKRFFTTRQALLHGDLHSGSIMVSEGKASVIDGEFSIIGPTGFDLGMFAGSLILAAFGATSFERRQELLNGLAVLRESFIESYCHEWNSRTGQADLSPAFLTKNDSTGLVPEQTEECISIISDATGFAAMEVIRRLTGYAHTGHFGKLSESEKGKHQYQALDFAIDLLSDLSSAPEKLFWSLHP
ncbi:S-methyl-5-thioribose kinase [Acetobacter sp.]|uniref:S-methyl-5-thioribose kinase n=1 Tax=Acetobacter sp. TaxID=440 RepID=UPI0039E9162B